MKTLILIFTAFSAIAFGQQKRNLVADLKDSLAVKNVNSILNNSKKTFSNYNLNLDSQSYSELNKNRDQLLVNTINFNTAMYNKVNQIYVGGNGYRIDAMDLMNRTIVSVPVYKAK